MKGKQNVLSEVNLIMICYNLRRLMSILDPKELKNRLKRPVAIFFALSAAISAILSDFLFPQSLSYHKITGHKPLATVP
jgi:hypothetical protein